MAVRIIGNSCKYNSLNEATSRPDFGYLPTSMAALQAKASADIHDASKFCPQFMGQRKYLAAVFTLHKTVVCS
jgi:hypothetical protein